MAVALRGYTQAVYASSGSQTVAWPAGTAVGDFAVLCMLEPQSGTPNSAPVDASVWKVGPSTGNSTVWGAPVTAAMLAAGLAVKANVAFLATFSGCGGIGRTSKSNGVQVTNAGGGLFVFVRDDTRTSTLTPAGGKLGTDVLNGKNRNRRSNVWFVAQSTTGFKKLSSTNATYFTSLELLPALPPSPPTLLSPANNSYINPSVVNTFVGRHNHPTMPQSRVNLRIREKTVPGSWLYLWADGTLNAATNSTASDVTSMPLAAGQLSAGSYEWQMQTAVDNSGTPLWSDLAATLSTVNVAPDPVVNSVTVSAPAGDLTPGVTATRTLGIGSQVAWQMRITPSSATASTQVTLWDSGVTPGDDLAWTLDPIDWTNGSSYKLWLRIQQAGGQWSAWTSGTFTVSWTPPTAPSGVVFAQGTPPTLTVSGVSGRNRLRAEYSEDGGSTWTTYTVVPVTGPSVTISLPLTPYGVPRLYGARASDTVDGTEQWSDRTIGTGAESSTDVAGYLVSDDGVDWMQIRMRADTARRRVEAIDVTYGLTGDGESPTAAVEYGPPQGWAGTTTLLGVLPADRAAIIDFWDLHRLFWIRFPAEVKGATIHDGGALRVARTSQVEVARIVQVAATPRDLPFEWVEQ